MNTNEKSVLKFYVSPEGNDAWSGKLPGPNAKKTDGPFATLERARNAIRQLKLEKNPQRPLTVMLRGGTYHRPQPFVLRPEDSGDEKCPVIYAAYPGEKPIISGGRTISGWKQTNGFLWTAELPEVKAGDWYFRQLFINGERRQRPRFPKEGSLPVVGSYSRSKDWAANIPDEIAKSSKDAFQFRPGDVKKDWHNIDDVEVVVLQYWTAARLRIASIDEEKNVVSFTGESFRPLSWSFGYYADNIYEGLDVPGSWYLDRRKGILYYHPLLGEDMRQVEAIAPISEQLVRFEGNVDGNNFVRHIVFSGLAFHYTTWKISAWKISDEIFPGIYGFELSKLTEEAYSFCQAELPLVAAIYAEGALYCRIEECELAHLGGWGIELGRGCQHNAIVDNTVRDVGAGCVKVGELVNCKKDVEEACNTLISDNRFFEGGQICLGPAAVWIGQSSGNTISHNEISGPFQWAISVGWTWSYFPLQRARDNIIEFNHIHHLGTGILGTHGAIYALGTSPGTVIRNNHIHHVFARTEYWGAGEGIILDNGCCGILVENNIVHDAVSGGYGSNFNCWGNIIQNNIFAFGEKYQLTVYGDPPSGKPQPKGEIFARNIVIWKEGPLIMESDWPNFSTLWNYNLYYQTGKKSVKFMKYSLDEWKNKGMDTESFIADPLFVDPENGDFTLRPESPAFKLGFKPVDVSNAGPR